MLKTLGPKAAGNALPVLCFFQKVIMLIKWFTHPMFCTGWNMQVVFLSETHESAILLTIHFSQEACQKWGHTHNASTWKSNAVGRRKFVFGTSWHKKAKRKNCLKVILNQWVCPSRWCVAPVPQFWGLLHPNTLCVCVMVRDMLSVKKKIARSYCRCASLGGSWLCRVHFWSWFSKCAKFNGVS